MVGTTHGLEGYSDENANHAPSDLFEGLIKWQVWPRKIAKLGSQKHIRTAESPNLNDEHAGHRFHPKSEPDRVGKSKRKLQYASTQTTVKLILKPCKNLTKRHGESTLWECHVVKYPQIYRTKLRHS